MQPWSEDRILSLAPDAASASAGRALAIASKWSGIGSSDRALWGLCQGSGKDPYQARIDLSEPAFKCSCPSRKFPCKHGIALFLLFARTPAQFKTAPEPDWVAQWLASRAERAEKKVERAVAAAEKPVDLEAQAKRAAQRESRVSDGLAHCRLFLEDLLRRGIVAARTDDSTAWDRLAARMVDAQAPGLATSIREVPALLASGEGWELRTFAHIGRLHLLVSAGERLAQLPAEVAQDVRTALGWTQSKEETLASAGLTDHWLVLGQITQADDRIRTRRTWLWGVNHARVALILDFSVGPQSFDLTLASGTRFDGEVAFYPARLPLRALIKSREMKGELSASSFASADSTIEAALMRHAHALAVNPFLTRWPLVLREVRMARRGDAWYLRDATGASLPLSPIQTSRDLLWKLLACVGTDPFAAGVEWDGTHATVLGAATQAGYLDCTIREVDS
ncbi:MAG: SWIM zinc finger family protein [Planctomycetota bacterium]|nr:SWIM zinc finger family protein [Planctomycetota bacterium]